MALGCLAIALPSLGVAQARGPQRPNILFLLIDDQRNDTLGCAGHPILKTPAIDRLAAEGVRFRNAFVTTPICAASRASILTGRVERTHGYTFGKPPMPASILASSYPALLQRAGYRTGFIGKYGIASDLKPTEIFDSFKPHGTNPYFKTLPDGTLRHETDLAGDKAVEFFESNPKGMPFCLSVSFNAVHAEDGDLVNHYPWPPSADGLYNDIEIPAPRLSDPNIFEQLPPFLKTSMNRIRYYWRWDTPEKYQRNMKAYFRMISGVDQVVGRIRGELERLHLADNTVIVTMGDNGYYMGERGLAGKWSHFEESLRVPLIVYDPRALQPMRGVVRDEMALNIDIASTFLDFAGAGVPARYQGQSLLPLLQGGSGAGWRHEFFCEHLMDHPDIPKWEGVRGDRYVYARYFEQQPAYEFLHDLKADPDERVNLAASPSFRALLQQMRAKCDGWKETYTKDAPPAYSARLNR